MGAGRVVWANMALLCAMGTSPCEVRGPAGGRDAPEGEMKF